MIVTADHRLTNDGNHGGNTTGDRRVPLFIASRKVKLVICNQPISQLKIAPPAGYLLGMDPPIIPSLID